MSSEAPTMMTNHESKGTSTALVELANASAATVAGVAPKEGPQATPEQILEIKSILKGIAGKKQKRTIERVNPKQYIGSIAAILASWKTHGSAEFQARLDVLKNNITTIIADEGYEGGAWNIAEAILAFVATIEWVAPPAPVKGEADDAAPESKVAPESKDASESKVASESKHVPPTSTKTIPTATESLATLASQIRPVSTKLTVHDLRQIYTAICGATSSSLPTTTDDVFAPGTALAESADARCVALQTLYADSAVICIQDILHDETEMATASCGHAERICIRHGRLAKDTPGTFTATFNTQLLQHLEGFARTFTFQVGAKPIIFGAIIKMKRDMAKNHADRQYLDAFVEHIDKDAQDVFELKGVDSLDDDASPAARSDACLADAKKRSWFDNHVLVTANAFYSRMGVAELWSGVNDKEKNVLFNNLFGNAFPLTKLVTALGDTCGLFEGIMGTFMGGIADAMVPGEDINKSLEKHMMKSYLDENSALRTSMPSLFAKMDQSLEETTAGMTDDQVQAYSENQIGEITRAFSNKEESAEMIQSVKEMVMDMDSSADGKTPDQAKLSNLMSGMISSMAGTFKGKLGIAPTARSAPGASGAFGGAPPNMMSMFSSMMAKMKEK